MYQFQYAPNTGQMCLMKRQSTVLLPILTDFLLLFYSKMNRVHHWLSFQSNTFFNVNPRNKMNR